MRNWTIFFIWIGIWMAGPVEAQQWETFATPTIPAGLSFLRTLESNVFVTSSGGLYRSQNGGEYWQKVRNYQDINGWQNFEVDKSTNRLYFTEGQDTSGLLKLYTSINMGDTWTYVGDLKANLSAFIGDAVYGADVVTGTKILRKQGNQPWQNLANWPSDTAGYIHDVCASGNHLWVAAQTGIYHSPDAGNTWEFSRTIANIPVYDPITMPPFMRIEALNGAIIIANDADDRVYRTQNNGLDWEEAAWEGKSLCNSGQHLFATDATGTQVLRLDGNDLSDWTFSPVPAYRYLDLRGAGEYNGTQYLGSDFFGVLRKKPESEVWGLANSNLNEGVNALVGLDDHLFLSVRGQIYSSDFGETWKSNLSTAFPYRSWVAGNYDYAAVDLNDQTHLMRCLRNERFEWTTQGILPSGISSISATGDTILAVVNNLLPARFYQSLDAGVTWNIIPSTLGRPKVVSWRGKFYLVRGASLYQSSDAGTSWQIAHTFPYTIDETVSRYYVSRDTLLISYPPEKKIFFSLDGGQNFDTLHVPASGNSPAFNLRAYGNDLILLQTDIISYSRDMGQTWQQISAPPGIGLGTVSSDLNSTYADNTLFVVGNWKLRLDAQRQAAGKVFMDVNGNGQQETNEQGLNNIVVNAGQSSVLGPTYDQGNFSLLLNSSAHSLSVDQVPPYYTVLPVVVAIPPGTDTIPDIIFAVQPQELVNDAVISLVPTAAFRAGYDNTLHLAVKNAGTLPSSGRLKLVVDPLLTVLNVGPVADETSGDTLIWNYSDLASLTEWKVLMEVNIAVVPPETPLSVWASVETQADADLANNTVLLNESVVTSFDPNDKSVSERDIPAETADSEELTYTIRFQNLGNTETDFITVRDTLSEALDAASVRVLAASHFYEWSIEEGRILVFRFNPIHLTPANVDSLRSQGFVQFSARLKPDLQPGDEISNTAHIYFDFNPAVVTNTVESSIQVVSTFEPASKSGAINIFPNPAGNRATFRLPEEIIGEGRIEIFSAGGRLVYATKAQGSLQEIDLTNMSSGTYWCRWQTESETYWEKLLKK
ncbi:MAG: T9SS type A sorting domain-containing protein [Saprospiraceae bacterium]|nr:T9SS type A sorting domain-containing protein [Saprospiraceae bacterium]